MPVKIYHSSLGGFDFLGLRKGATGATEIVYDDGVSRRTVWRVSTKTSDHKISDALRYAVDQTRVVPALMSELKRRAIAIEVISA